MSRYNKDSGQGGGPAFRPVFLSLRTNVGWPLFGTPTHQTKTVPGGNSHKITNNHKSYPVVPFPHFDVDMPFVWY